MKTKRYFYKLTKLSAIKYCLYATCLILVLLVKEVDVSSIAITLSLVSAVLLLANTLYHIKLNSDGLQFNIYFTVRWNQIRKVEQASNLKIKIFTENYPEGILLDTSVFGRKDFVKELKDKIPSRIQKSSAPFSLVDSD